MRFYVSWVAESRSILRIAPYLRFTVLQSDIALKLLIISKNVLDRSFSVREGRHTRPPYFFISGGAEATSRSAPLF